MRVFSYWRWIFWYVWIIGTLIFGAVRLSAQPVKPIPRSHAHNDYNKLRTPLYGALRQGIVSVEVDIFPRKGRLKVAHIPVLLGLRPNLERMYFRRLEKWLDTHKHLYSDTSQTLTLMLDIKKNPAQAYALLLPLCQKYSDILVKRYPQKDSMGKGKIQILLSGSKPYTEVLASAKTDSVQYMFLDAHIGTDLVGMVAPRVSNSYRGFTKWRGKGKNKKLPTHKTEELTQLVQTASQKGQTVRFWAMPNNKRVWRTFWNAGAVWMNIDKIRKFRRWWENSEQ
jgi:hypothetical protein